MLLVMLLTAMTAWAQEPTIYAGFIADDASGGYGNEGYDRLVDGKFTSDNWTKWGTDSKSTPHDEKGSYYWIDFHANEAIGVAKYILTTGNDNTAWHNRNPKSWVLKGKLKQDDEWTTIATVKGDNTMQDKDFESCVGLKSVGLASDEAPCLGIIDVIPSGLDENSALDVAMVGKGITFDTGGYSLKPEKFMETMRTDKTAVIYLSGALCLALKLGLKKRCRLYLCCSENMVSGRGMLPGDIIKYPNDISVEINNTDAEGRLVLADGLLKASGDNPAFILDMATLTGAAKVAVGRDMFSVLTRETSLYSALKSAFDGCGEMYWQLPLAPYHRRFLSSRRATVTNSGHGEGAPGSSVAASFLEQFVKKDIPWVHIDLSSAYLPDGSPFLAAGPTGSTILGLATFLAAR